MDVKELSDFQKIFEALHSAQVKYLVVGGVAMALHGHLRYTRDLDLAVDLSSDNLVRALEALASLGYRPAAPVDIVEFIDPNSREKLIKEKNMVVFSLWSEKLRATEVDLFARMPFEFSSVYTRKKDFEIDGIPVSSVSLEDLIQMKEDAGRHIDQEDIKQLKKIQNIQNED